MTFRPLYLIDQSAGRVGTLDVVPAGDHFEGTILLEGTPQMRQLFEEFEDIVEGQIFSLLDDIEEKIAAHSLRAVFENGAVADVCDLQVFPSTGAVSLKTREPMPVE